MSNPEDGGKTSVLEDATMKALRFSKFGPPSALAIENIPKPQPRDGEALVQVKATAINPSDVKNVSGNFSAMTLPRTPGRDFSGIVVEGNQLEGAEVWGTEAGLGIVRDGAHAEYVTVPIQTLSRKPASLSMEQAAAIGVPFTTAWAALVRAAQLRAGESVLIVGARGAVGQAATRIVARPCSSCGTSRRPISADASAVNPLPFRCVSLTVTGALKTRPS